MEKWEEWEEEWQEFKKTLPPQPGVLELQREAVEAFREAACNLLLSDLAEADPYILATDAYAAIRALPWPLPEKEE